MKYSVQDGMVVRDDGFVAVRHYNSNPSALSFGEVTYIWTPKMNVSLAWIHPEHLTRVLNQSAKMCCGRSGKKYMLVGYENVNLHTFGTREYQGE